MRLPKYWIKAVLRRPYLIRWYFHWQSSIDSSESPLKDELPWVTYEAIDWLSRYLTKDMIIFEWGSGGSTAFFSTRVSQVITIEHDAAWFQEVTFALTQKACTNVSLNLVSPVPSATADTLYYMKARAGRSQSAGRSPRLQ